MATEDASDEMRPFNFSRAGIVAHEQMRALRTLDEQFARNLTHTLAAWLRTSITVAPTPSEQGVFSQFMEKTAAGCHATTLRLEPLQVRGVMALDLELAPSIIEMLLGGSGRAASSRRELTEIEAAVLGSVLDLVLREWNTAWAPFGLDFVTEVRDRESHGQRLMPLQEKVFCCRFSVTLAEITGQLHFCMPSSAVLSALRSFAQRRDRQRQRTEEERRAMLQRMNGAGLRAALHFPSMRLRADDLRSLQPGDLLPLPLQRNVPAELRVAGVTVFAASPVRSGDHRGAQLVSRTQSSAAAGGEA